MLNVQAVAANARVALDRARSLIEAFGEHQATGRAALVFDGGMVDAPHLTRARRLLDRAAP